MRRQDLVDLLRRLGDRFQIDDRGQRAGFVELGEFGVGGRGLGLGAGRWGRQLVGFVKLVSTPAEPGVDRVVRKSVPANWATRRLVASTASAKANWHAERAIEFFVDG